MTSLQEPFYSIDPFDWNVYGDWLEDHFLDPTKARNIAKGLQKTGGKLFLYYKNNIPQYKKHKEIMSIMGIISTEDNPNIIGHGKYWMYVWKEQEDEQNKLLNEESKKHPISIQKMPLIVRQYPYIAEAYWNTLAEIGAKI